MAKHIRSGKNGKPTDRRPWAWRGFICGTLALVLLGQTSCTRRFFRHRADRDVDAMLAEKNVDPRWKLENFHVYPDPRARFADWTNPDRPPKPPDDPAADKLAPRPQRPRNGIQYVAGKGYLEMMAMWDEENRGELAAAAEEIKGLPSPVESGGAGYGASPATSPLSPASAIPNIQRELTAPVLRDRPLPISFNVATKPEQKPYLLKLEQVVELGLINSREMQLQREQLYLAALPVTLERFAFAAQFFALEQIVREYFGTSEPGGRQNLWAFNSSIGFGKLFATGGLLLAQFSNQTAINLGSLLGRAPIRETSTSTMSLDVIQPFLRGGGRAVTLEPLTQAERNLLYAMRDFYRRRQEYFVIVAAGQPAFIPGITAGVAALLPATMGQPGVFTPGGTPPPGSLVGPSLGVPSVNPGEGGAFFRPVASPTPVPQGVLGTIQDWAVLTNNYKNVRSLQNFLDRFHTFQEGGLVNPVQVGQVEQTLLQSIEGVLTAHATYRVDYDEVKTQIGIPITVPLVFDDSLYRPIFRQLYRYETLATEYQAAIDANLALNRPEDLKQLRARLHQQLRDAAISRGTQSLQAIERLWAEWEKLPNQPPLQKPLNNRLRQLLEERRKLLDLNEAYAAKNQPLPEKDARRLDELELDIDVGKLERTLRGFEATLAKVGGQPIVTFRMVHRDFVTLFEWAYKEQEDKIRESWPALPPYCVNGVDILSADEDVALDTVARTALTNRVDLMNVRGELVDAWRKIAVTANSLLGTVNVQYHLDASTPAELAQPFDFSASRSRHELLFNLQPPLVRRAERNNYRSTLIAYQQMRRTLMGYEDNILYGVRFQLRSLRAVANNYQRIQRRAIELAYRQVGLALEAFNAPQIPTGPEKIPGLVGGPVQTSAGDPAALTNQLLTAQSNLVRAQNDLYTQWNGYLTTRLNQYRDLGLMPLDARGVWIDDVANCDCQPSVPGQPGPGPERPSREPPDQLPEPRPVPPAAGAPVGAGR